MPKGQWNKINWTPSMISFIHDWWPVMSNKELAAIINIHITTLRAKVYKMGYYRMRLDFWTPDQTEFLKANYKKIGDVELAEIFQNKFPKNKPWTIKHIEKKRKYLNLKRTEMQLFRIKLRNIDQGRMDGLNWTATHMRRRIRIGTCITRTINGYKVKLVRIQGGFRKLAHVNYEKHIGPIPSGKMLILKDNNPLNCEPENLEMVSRQVFAQRMRDKDGTIAFYLSLKGRKCMRGNYKDKKLFKELLKHPELLQAKRNQLKLNHKIKEHETSH